MAAFSAWTNLSECTFMLPPTGPRADYRERIFALTTELPFAGHPTLGTARAWLDAGGVPRTPSRVIQQCGIGLVRVRIDEEMLAFAAPPLIRSDPVDDADLAVALSVPGVTAARVVTTPANLPRRTQAQCHPRRADLLGKSCRDRGDVATWDPPDRQLAGFTGMR
jgi:predicted PhzF superfamily epimerase YddE/YHI9